MTNDWMIAAFAAAVGLVSGLFSGLAGRRLEEWLFRPRLVVEFIENETGFRTEGKWKRNDIEFSEIYIRARVRNRRGRLAKQCRPYLVKLEKVDTAGRVTPTAFADSFVLRWPGPRRDYAARDLPRDVNQFFDVVGILRNEPGWRFTFEEKFTEHAELADYRGTYRFTVLVVGDCVTPGSCKIDITYHGDPDNLDAAPVRPRRWFWPW